MTTTRTVRPRKGKGMIRALVREGAQRDHRPPVSDRTQKLTGKTMCERCGSVFEKRHWRASTPAERAQPIGFRWTVCPACRQVAEGEFFGRVRIRGASALEREPDLRARIARVERRARHTQPERRVVSIERQGDTIEVLTTSQKLAHRVVRSLLEAFGGRATYSWTADEGALEATWTWGRPETRD